MATKRGAQVPEGRQPPGPRDDGLEALRQFLNLFEQLPAGITEALLRVAVDDEEKPVVEALGAALGEQVRELSTFVRESATNLSAQGRLDVARVMRWTAGATLAKSGLGLTSDLATPAARLGISEIFDLIKKIIRMLLKILKKLGISVPWWVEDLLELINEIKNAFLSRGMPRLAPIFSQNHQNMLAELTQLERLQRESSWRFASEENEE